MHPLGAMKYDVPKTLVEAGAQTFGKPRELTCVVCHSTHSSTHKPLLILPADTNQLCLSCHDKDLAAKAAGGAMCKHGQSPKLTAEQRAVVEGRGGRVGADGELLCVSCHKVHKAEPDSTLQVFRPTVRGRLQRLPPGQDGRGGHRARPAPQPARREEHHRRDARDGRRCAVPATRPTARPARPRRPLADVSGHCTTCHQETGLRRRARLAGNAGHPDSKCTACHDPHKGRTRPISWCSPARALPHMPRRAVPAGRRAARSDEAPGEVGQRPGGRGRPVPRPATSRTATKGTGLFRAAVQADSYHDAICLECHPRHPLEERDRRGRHSSAAGLARAEAGARLARAHG